VTAAQTSATATAPEDTRPGPLVLLDHLLHPRKAAEQVSSDLAATATALGKARARLLTGQYVRFRFGQMLIWSVVAGLVGAAFVSGLYDGVLQINWYIHAGPVNVQLFYLKPGWDSDAFGLVHSGNWALYRHLAFRDIAAPAFATMAVQTLLSKPKWWTVRVSTARIVTAPLVIIALTFALGVLGVYLAYFGLPDLWAHLWSAAGHPGYRVTRLSVLGKLSADQLLIGFLIGRVLHRYWAPIGATLQGNILDRSVDRWQYKLLNRAGMPLDDAITYNNKGLRILPAWWVQPVSPPVIRERLALMWPENADVDARSAHAWVITIIGFTAFLIILLGFAGHYWAGEGHTMTYLFPGS
jgi:hypothetical protein